MYGKLFAFPVVKEIKIVVRQHFLTTTLEKAFKNYSI